MSNLIQNHGGLIPKEYRGESFGMNELTGLPKLFRGILLGSSGSGKSNLLIDFLKKSPHVYSQLHLCAHQPDQPLYHYLRDKLEGFITMYDESNPPLVENVKKQGVQLVVFDDFSNNQRFCQDYVVPWFIKGRHKNCTVLFLAHAFHAGVPKMARLSNEVLMILKSPSKADLKSVLRDMPISGVSDDQLWSFYQQTSKKKGQMLLINTLDQTIRYNWKQILHDGMADENRDD